nr:hypothetical protein [Candidatus Profftella armatura (Diaphorina cf. continua)]
MRKIIKNNVIVNDYWKIFYENDRKKENVNFLEDHVIALFYIFEKIFKI